jgi:NADH:ubiquinone oxidoreductase subunit 4 (subunit M)
MILSSLVIVPILGTILVARLDLESYISILYGKIIALSTSILNLVISLILFIFFHSSTNQYQYVQEHYNVQLFDIHLGVDGVSIFFILLTTIIMPIAILSN